MPTDNEWKRGENKTGVNISLYTVLVHVHVYICKSKAYMGMLPMVLYWSDRDIIEEGDIT